MQALLSSESNEWYTPPKYVELARQVMGSIDLDPASNEIAQKWVQAKTWYSKDDDGLKQPWRGNVWLNPPYGQRSQAKGIYGASAWIERAIEAHMSSSIRSCILLVRGDSEGLRALLEIAPSCDPGRIDFIRPEDGLAFQPSLLGEAEAIPSRKGNPVPGCSFYYLGPTPKTFAEVFRQCGPIRVPYSWMS